MKIVVTLIVVGYKFLQKWCIQGVHFRVDVLVGYKRGLIGLVVSGGMCGCSVRSVKINGLGTMLPSGVLVQTKLTFTEPKAGARALQETRFLGCRYYAMHGYLLVYIMEVLLHFLHSIEDLF